MLFFAFCIPSACKFYISLSIFYTHTQTPRYTYTHMHNSAGILVNYIASNNKSLIFYCDLFLHLFQPLWFVSIMFYSFLCRGLMLLVTFILSIWYFWYSKCYHIYILFSNCLLLVYRYVIDFFFFVVVVFFQIFI